MSLVFSVQDELYMRQALELATIGEGRVSPNPPVGCVLVRDGVVVGKGWHDRLGDLHAEGMALRDAGDKARGATAYVTLSPCTTVGRQPACSKSLIAAGVGKVLVAAPDPNPKNSCGVEELNAAGIPARTGLLREEAEYLARGFFKKMRVGLPYVTAKYAMTLDGKIATRTGDSRWISNEQSREWVHDFRSRVDAVLVGSGTVLADDPLLTVRGPVWEKRSTGGGHRQPARVVIDSAFQMPPAASMLQPIEGEGGQVIIAGIRGKNDNAAATLRDAGANAVLYDADEKGHTPLRQVLLDLAAGGVNMVLCEGGGGLIAALLEQRLVDEVAVFIAPKLVGGTNAPGPIGGEGLAKMSDALQISTLEKRDLGGDIFVRGRINAAVENNLT